MRIACIGDIHGFWDDVDTQYFSTSTYEHMLFVGDLPRITGGLDVARKLAGLSKSAWMIPGNHDGCSILQLLAEIKGWKTLTATTSLRMGARMRALQAALGGIDLAGYAHDKLDNRTGLIRARPHAMGPDRFYYEAYMRRAYGVKNYAESADRLKALVDQAPERIVFLAHNGPAGLGAKSTDIWGCDFSSEFGDFGDPDLACAIEHARETGRQVLAVIAGHMHHRHKKGGGERVHSVRQDGTLYINAASVARIREGGERRYHVALTLGEFEAKAVETWVDNQGRIVEARPCA